MAKTQLNLNHLAGHILSPGNIFWQRKSGAFVLISSKSDFLNLELIQKLHDAELALFIDDQINFYRQNEMTEYFLNHEKELLVKEKIQWRNKLIHLFATHFIQKSGQFEVDLLAWKVFSKMNPEESKAYSHCDIDLFKRSLSIAGSLSFCAFLLGYYSDDFLSKLFLNTLRCLMEVEKIDLISNIKNTLEELRSTEELSEGNRQFLKSIYPKSVLAIHERFNGSGVLGLSKDEMIDLEIVLVALCRHYSYFSSHEQTIFYEIKHNRFNCDQNILDIMKRVLEKKEERLELSA